MSSLRCVFSSRRRVEGIDHRWAPVTNLGVEFCAELELQRRLLLDILAQNPFVELESGLVVLGIGVLQAEEPGLPQPDGVVRPHEVLAQAQLADWQGIRNEATGQMQLFGVSKLHFPCSGKCSLSSLFTSHNR